MLESHVADSLETLAYNFLLGLDRHDAPARVWHYAPADGVLGILRSGRLWMTSSRRMEDKEEINWGNQSVCNAAQDVINSLGSSPALEMMLNDRNATLFMREDEMFIACFTEAADAADHWARNSGSKGGAAIVFRTSALMTLARSDGGTALLKVFYDASAIRRLADDYFRAVIDFAGRAQSDDSTSESSRRHIAQVLMEPGVLAFASKQPAWAWEREWRIIIRTSTRLPPMDSSRRRELPLPTGPSGAIEEIVVAPDAPRNLEAQIREQLAANWNEDGVRVRRSSACL